MNTRLIEPKLPNFSEGRKKASIPDHPLMRSPKLPCATSRSIFKYTWTISKPFHRRGKTEREREGEKQGNRLPLKYILRPLTRHIHLFAVISTHPPV